MPRRRTRYVVTCACPAPLPQTSTPRGRPDQPDLLALGPELIQVGRPVRAARGVRGAGAVPATDAGDGLLAVLVLVDHVTKRFGLTGAVGGAGQGQGTSVQGCGLLGTSGGTRGCDAGPV